MKTVLIAIAAAATLATAVPASAESTRVGYSDLDLTTEKGQVELDRRILKAARAACGYNDVQTGTRMVPQSIQRCVKDATLQARTQFAAIVESQQKGG